MVFGHAHGLGYAGQGVLGDQLVLGLAQEQPDGRVVVGGLELRVHGGQVEIQLAGVLGREGSGLQFHHHVALEAHVIEEQVDEELVAVHFDALLAADEGEPRAQL